MSLCRELCSLRSGYNYRQVHLVEMLRISLHAVDYATKAYALGLVEFALSAPSGRKRLEYLSQTIIATTQQLYETEELDDLQLGFIESAGNLCGPILHMSARM